MNEWVDTPSSERCRKEGQEQSRKEETERPFTIRPICPKAKKTPQKPGFEAIPRWKTDKPQKSEGENSSLEVGLC